MIQEHSLCILSVLLSKLHCYENKGPKAFKHIFPKANTLCSVHKNHKLMKNHSFQVDCLLEQSFAVRTDDLNPDSRLGSTPQSL